MRFKETCHYNSLTRSSYIHGGAWRDPTNDSSAIQPSLSSLLPAAASIEGVASINYRLSNSRGSDDAAHNALHPDHIEDVLTAICWLENKYRFGDRYILVGHSAGATLAFQAVCGSWKARDSTSDYPLAAFVNPIAVTGVAGIYDFQVLLKSFPVPFYRSFIEAAFGKDETIWKRASPAHVDLSHWTNARYVVLADSDEDEAIDTLQADAMWSHLIINNSVHRFDVRIKLRGDHDDMWEKGHELAKAILHTLDLLIESL